MLQLLDLGRENAALKCEVERLREETRNVRLLLGLVESALQLSILRLLDFEPLEHAPADVGRSFVLGQSSPS